MTLDIQQHKAVYLQILKEIYDDQELSILLGFKGGTAALLFYDLPRFSVDLDFDLLDESKEVYVFKKMQKLLENYGDLREAESKRFNIFYRLSYKGIKDGAYTLKIEINKRPFGSTFELKDYMGLPMKVMAQEDMAAHKLVAMYERIGKANRDIFDVHFFFQNRWPINKELVEKRTGMLYKAFLEMCITALEKESNHNILHGLGELLTEKQKVWVKAKLKDDTLFLLKIAHDGENKEIVYVTE